jgi:hypothetical protein
MERGYCCLIMGYCSGDLEKILKKIYIEQW